MGTSTDHQVKRPRLFARGEFVPFSLVTALFFLWGVPNNLNDVLIRQFMTSFAISRFQAGLVQSAFYLGYFTLAMPAAMLMRKAGYKTGILTGLVLFACGTFLFWPAAVVDRYSLFLIALFVIASGLAFLETGSNSLIAGMGDAATSEQRLNFSQAFNPLGAISGVAIGTIFIFSGRELTARQVADLQRAHQYAAYLHAETLRVVRPYLVLGVVALVLAFVLSRVRLPEPQREHHGHLPGNGVAHLLRQPFFLLSVLAQFLYVGAQVGTWSYFIQYVQETVRQPEKVAGAFLTGTLVAFAVGRFVSAWLMRFVQPASLMGGYSVVNMGLVMVGVLHPGWAGLWALFTTSFFMSLMFPTIFAMGLRGLGEDTKLGGSLLVMAIVGGAVLTPIMGLVSQRFGIATAYVIPLTCYACVGLYSLMGMRQGSRE